MMARPASISTEEVLGLMRKTFRRKGFDGTSLADLAAETGLAKAGLYHRFPGGKSEMAEVVLQDLKAWMAGRVLEPLKLPGDPLAKLQAMVAALGELYEQGKQPCLIGQFSVGESLDRFQQRLAASVLTLQESIAGTLVDAGMPRRQAQRRAEDAVIRIQGSLVVSRIQQDTGPFVRTMRDLPVSLLRKS